MEDKISVNAEIIEFEAHMPTETEEKHEKQYEEPIRLYQPPDGIRRKRRVFLWRFALTTVLFFLIFLFFAEYIKDINEEKQNAGVQNSDFCDAVTTAPEESEASAEAGIVSPIPPLVIDESKIGVIVNVNDDYSLEHLIEASDGVKVIIVHSHNSEFVSESVSVSDAGGALGQILTSAGIAAYHCLSDHDSSGSIGAYSRMKETLCGLIEKYPDTVCIIDVHDSDSGLPLTFTVGTDGNGWGENLRLAEAVCGRLSDIESAFRFLPGTIGQDSGVLTLNIGIGGREYADADSREVIASVASAIIEICIEKASASQ